jgi:hypothetical protein
MGYKKFLINELEKKDILNQYGLLIEQSVVDPKPVTTLDIDKNVQFPAGYWSEKYLLQTLGPEIEKVKNYLKSGKGKIYLVSVTIESGESQLPNVDAESGNKSVEPLYLATKRNESIRKYVTTQLQSFVDQKLLISLPNFKVAQPKIGVTPFVNTPFCPQGSTKEQQRNKCVKKYRAGKTTTYKSYADKYLLEQYVRVAIKLEELTGMKECLDNMVIEVNYTDLSKTHRCNSAIYEIFLNDIKLMRNDGKGYASLNNNYPNAKNYPGIETYDDVPKLVGGKRTNTFIITPDIASDILSKTIGVLANNQKLTFTLKAKCLNPFNNKDWSGGCHKGVGNIVVTNGKKQVFKYDSSTPNGKDEVKTLVTFDACGSGEAV